jgi:choline-sulfatase
VADIEERDGTTRRRLLGAAAVAGTAAALPARAAARLPRPRGPKRSVKGMNVVMFVTDQERAIQHFPEGWARKNLPGLRRLRRNGLTFHNAFTNACMCSPARSTWMTGFFPAQHGVKWTLEQSMPDDQYPQVEMPLDFNNIASVMKAAGYTTVYKGKWHLNKPANGSTWVPEDVGKYGWERWNPQDAGANQTIPEAGGGSTDNDGRFIYDDGPAAAGEEGALAYINSQAAADAPFFLVVSLVNPHDVLFYPRTYLDAGYDDGWLRGTIKPPETADEDLSTKPSVQKQFLRLFNLTGRINTPEMQRKYLNFYGNLMRSSDDYLVQVLDALDANGLTDDTLVIRTADHGEMGLAHGGLRQKNFNFYEESLKVPLIFSNPRLYKKPIRSNHLVSHVDFVPTICKLFGVPKRARSTWAGKDYSWSVLQPEGARPPQDYIAFTYDDYQSGQPNGPYPQPPNHIVSIREKRWKLARYYDINGETEPQWEMYDLRKDPLEKHNIAHDRKRMSARHRRQFKRLRKKLDRVERNRLQPVNGTPQPLTPPS